MLETTQVTKVITWTGKNVLGLHTRSCGKRPYPGVRAIYSVQKAGALSHVQTVGDGSWMHENGLG